MSWKVSIKDIIERNYDLDIKNPNTVVEEVVYDRKAIISKLENNQSKKEYNIIKMYLGLSGLMYRGVGYEN